MDELWIIRHAESKGNAGQVTSGQDSNSLTPRGRAQAAALADCIERMPDDVEATTYFRTQQTAAPTLARFGIREYRVSSRFREMTYLNPLTWNGTTQEQRKAAAKQFWDRCDPDYVDGDGADSFNRIATNTRQGLVALHRKKGKYGQLYSHGLIMSLIDLMIREPELEGVALMRAFRQARDGNLNAVPNCAVLQLKKQNGFFAHINPSQPFLNLIGN